MGGKEEVGGREVGKRGCEGYKGSNKQGMGGKMGVSQR